MRRGGVLLLGLALAACDTPARARTADSGAAAAAPGAGTASARPVRVSAAWPDRFGGVGRAPTADEIRAWDIDANPTGVGLPPGQGTHARGAGLYMRRCAACHGARGEGLPPNPRLIGREPLDFSFARDPKAPRTIGNYWPYATTLYDYINRAMPFDAPGSLSPADVYSVVAFLLAENGIVDTNAVMDARTLPAVRMPARNRFVVDDRRGGPVFR